MRLVVSVADFHHLHSAFHVTGNKAGKAYRDRVPLARKVFRHKRERNRFRQAGNFLAFLFTVHDLDGIRDIFDHGVAVAAGLDERVGELFPTGRDALLVNGTHIEFNLIRTESGGRQRDCPVVALLHMRHLLVREDDRACAPVIEPGRVDSVVILDGERQLVIAFGGIHASHGHVFDSRGIIANRNRVRLVGRRRHLRGLTDQPGRVLRYYVEVDTRRNDAASRNHKAPQAILLMRHLVSRVGRGGVRRRRAHVQHHRGDGIHGRDIHLDNQGIAFRLLDTDQLLGVLREFHHGRHVLFAPIGSIGSSLVQELGLDDNFVIIAIDNRILRFIADGIRSLDGVSDGNIDGSQLVSRGSVRIGTASTIRQCLERVLDIGANGNGVDHRIQALRIIDDLLRRNIVTAVITVGEHDDSRRVRFTHDLLQAAVGTIANICTASRTQTVRRSKQQGLIRSHRLVDSRGASGKADNRSPVESGHFFNEFPYRFLGLRNRGTRHGATFVHDDSDRDAAGTFRRRHLDRNRLVVLEQNEVIGIETGNGLSGILVLHDDTCADSGEVTQIQTRYVQFGFRRKVERISRLDFASIGLGLDADLRTGGIADVGLAGNHDPLVKHVTAIRDCIRGRVGSRIEPDLARRIDAALRLRGNCQDIRDRHMGRKRLVGNIARNGIDQGPVERFTGCRLERERRRGPAYADRVHRIGTAQERGVRPERVPPCGQFFRRLDVNHVPGGIRRGPSKVHRGSRTVAIVVVAVVERLYLLGQFLDSGFPEVGNILRAVVYRNQGILGRAVVNHRRSASQFPRVKAVTDIRRGPDIVFRPFPCGIVNSGRNRTVRIRKQFESHLGRRVTDPERIRRICTRRGGVDLNRYRISSVHNQRIYDRP